jgi:hypothetical protein
VQDYLLVGFFALAAVAVCEAIASGRWIPAYFRTGITIYKRDYRAHFELTVDTAELEREFGVSVVPPLLFHRIEEGEYAFRERLFDLRFFKINYTPIMRGHIQVRGTTATVVGRLNWAVLLVLGGALAAFPTIASAERSGLDGVPIFIVGAFLAAFGSIYAVQCYRYGNVGAFIARDRRTL